MKSKMPGMKKTAASPTSRRGEPVNYPTGERGQKSAEATRRAAGRRRAYPDETLSDVARFKDLQQRIRDGEWLSESDFRWMMEFASRNAKTEHEFLHEEFNSPERRPRHRRKRKPERPEQRERRVRRQREARARRRAHLANKKAVADPFVTDPEIILPLKRNTTSMTTKILSDWLTEKGYLK
jgi:hypothetical protein